MTSGLTYFNDPTIPMASAGVPGEATDPFRELADAVIQAAEDAIGAVARLWSAPPTAAIGTPGAGGATEPTAAVGLIQGSLSWYTGAVAVLAVLIVAGRMAWARRGRSAVDLLRGLGTLVLVSAAGVTAVTLFAGVGDAFASWILAQATDDVEAAFVELVALPEAGEMPAVLAILIGSAAIVAAVLQIVLLLARGAVLVVLTGVLPLTASATSTQTGRAIFTRTVTWIVAFVLYQPVAALIYATALVVVPDSGASPVVAALAGTTTVGLAIAALPALLRILRPVALAVANGGSRTPEAGTVLPTGARAVPPASLRGGPVLHGAGPMASRLPAATRVDARTAPRAVAGALGPGRAAPPSGRRSRAEVAVRDVPVPHPRVPHPEECTQVLTHRPAAGEDPVT